MSVATQGQLQFASALSRALQQYHLSASPRVLAAQAVAEMSGGFARGREAKHDYNWLNIGHTDARNYGVTFGDPRSAAQQTAAWIAGKNTLGYGRAASSITRAFSGNMSDAQRIQAIAKSGWASSGYNGGRDLQSLYAQLNGVPTGSAAGITGVPAATPAQPQQAPAQTHFADEGPLQGLLDANAKLAKIPAVRLPHVAVPAVIQDHATAQAMPSSSGINQAIIQAAKQFLGIKYTWGGTSPKTGFDCSGLMQYVFKRFGINLPRVSEEQFKAGKAVAPGQARPGDLVFFRHASGDVGHVGLYLGGGTFLEAPHTGDVVKIAKVSGDVAGYRRFTP